MIWAIISVVLTIMLVIDWIIVMGKNPKEWKGGKQDDQGTGFD